MELAHLSILLPRMQYILMLTPATQSRGPPQGSGLMGAAAHVEGSVLTAAVVTEGRDPGCVLTSPDSGRPSPPGGISVGLNIWRSWIKHHFVFSPSHDLFLPSLHRPSHRIRGPSGQSAIARRLCSL